jgi:SAM-dependent methyltransferase
MLMGALPEDLHGIDLLPDRVAAARRLNPAIDVVQGTAMALPWPDASFDLVSQFTTFTSILEPRARAAAASEIMRVLRPSGHILWYDFWLNPTNPHTRGIPPTEIKSLFPGFSGRFRRLTLAPPLARFVAPRSHLVAGLLQEVRPLQSHYLALLSAARNGT